MAHFAEYISLRVGARIAAQPVLAILTQRNFELARARAPAFAVWRNHAEFVEEREAQVFGYGTAGATARLQTVPFAAFERWVRLTGAQADLSGLDDFAAHWRWRRKNAGAPSKGRFASHDAPDIRRVAEAGVQIVDIFADSYERWRDALAGALPCKGPPSIDVYAGLVIETCIGLVGDRRGARRRPSAGFTPVNSK